MSSIIGPPGGACTFRVALRSGVWSVTRNHTFYGDYLSRSEALRGACSAARAVEARDGAARVVAGRDETLVAHHDAKFRT